MITYSYILTKVNFAAKMTINQPKKIIKPMHFKMSNKQPNKTAIRNSIKLQSDLQSKPPTNNYCQRK